MFAHKSHGRILGALTTALMLFTPGLVAAEDPEAQKIDLRGADHLVTVGADDPGSPGSPSKIDRFEYFDYYPNKLEVHSGDVVRFAWGGAHTVTFYPGGERQDSLFVPDELPGDVRGEGFFPSRYDCAVGLDREHLPPCVLDSTEEYFNSGVAVANPDFASQVRFDLPPGTYSYFCAFHPGMRGRIKVVPDAKRIATPEEVEKQRQAQIAADTKAAEKVVERSKQPRRRVVDGVTRWQVQIGARTPDGRVEILSYLPANLTVAPDEEVEFVMPKVKGGVEWHTATFLRNEVGVAVEYTPLSIDIRCDADGKDTGAPGVTGALATLVTAGEFGIPENGCVLGEIEAVYGPTAYERPLRSPGDVVRGPEPVHDSGVLSNPTNKCADTCDPWTNEPLPDRFEAVFPEAGTFSYFCYIHDSRGMFGSITVEEP